jgi:hypothetical protein
MPDYSTQQAKEKATHDRLQSSGQARLARIVILQVANSPAMQRSRYHSMGAAANHFLVSEVLNSMSTAAPDRVEQEATEP